MYLAQTTKDRIKSICKSKNINMETLVSECELGVNAIRQINDTKGMASFSLARIADYLDCSVDYFLGRTDDPLSHKTGAIKKNLATRLREVMHIRSEQLKRINPKRDYGALYWEEKSGGTIKASDIATLLNSGTGNYDIIISLARLFNVSVNQLIGEEVITAKSIHPYMAKPLGAIENGMRFVHSAANSDEGIYDENIDTDDEEFMAMANEPRGEDIE